MNMWDHLFNVDKPNIAPTTPKEKIEKKPKEPAIFEKKVSKETPESARIERERATVVTPPKAREKIQSFMDNIKPSKKPTLFELAELKKNIGEYENEVGGVGHEATKLFSKINVTESLTQRALDYIESAKNSLSPFERDVLTTGKFISEGKIKYLGGLDDQQKPSGRGILEISGTKFEGAFRSSIDENKEKFADFSIGEWLGSESVNGKFIRVEGKIIDPNTGIRYEGLFTPFNDGKFEGAGRRFFPNGNRDYLEVRFEKGLAQSSGFIKDKDGSTLFRGIYNGDGKDLHS
jgi:hypothetical protein